MYFWTCGFLKTWLDKCLKSPVWEDPPTSNKINGPKHCWNLNRSTFTIFMYHCEGNSVGKSLSQAYAKSWDILLTHWLPMTSILCLIDTIYCHIFKCNYLRNKRVFLNFVLFFCHFRKSRFNFAPFQNKDDPHSWCVFQLTDSENID